MDEVQSQTAYSLTRNLTVKQIEEQYGPAATAVLLATGKRAAGSRGRSYHANGGGDGGGVSLVYAPNELTDWVPLSTP